LMHPAFGSTKSAAAFALLLLVLLLAPLLAGKNLLPPRELADSLWRMVAAPQLKTMLARAAMSSDATMDAEAWLCQRFGIARQQDFPLAPLLARNEQLAVQYGYWLCATPVHLEARRSALVANSTLIELQREQVAAWINLYRALGGGWSPDQVATNANATPR